MLSPDIGLLKKQRWKESREDADEKRKEREKQRTAKEASAKDTEDVQEIIESEPQQHQDPDYKPTAWHLIQMRKKPDKALLELPTKTLTEATAIIAARCRHSTNEVLTLFAKIITMGGGDLHHRGF